jgi:argininosuccinate lyase
MTLKQTENYIVNATQLRVDLQMVAYDLWGTRAHINMLAQVGVLTDGESSELNKALDDIQLVIDSGQYVINPDRGAQLSLEDAISQRVGKELGGKVHTGRSRNDQVMAAQRLYLRERLLGLHADMLDLIDTLLVLAGNHVETVMPGYTHMQPAKPTSVAQWLLGYVDMLRRDSQRFSETYARLNISPLGAAESFGTSWPLDRQLTAQLLGFDAVQEIPPDVVSSRGENEAEILSNLSFVAIHFSKLAQDLLLYTTYEYRYVALADNVASRMGSLTGSSIMPQKRNPDILELLRADASGVFADLFHTFEVLKALPSGYNRDTREAKSNVVSGLDRCANMIKQMQIVIESLTFDKARMRQAVLENYSLATDLADYLAQTFKLPYRFVYRLVGETVNRAVKSNTLLTQSSKILADVAQELDLDIDTKQIDLSQILEPEVCLARRKHVGGAAPEETHRLIKARQQNISTLRQQLDDSQKRIDEAHTQCITYVNQTKPTIEALSTAASPLPANGEGKSQT